MVSWSSLDHGGPVVVRVAADMVPGWNQIPLFSNRFEGYYFFIWHPWQGVAPPAANSILGPNDTAMLAVLEASLPAMNQQVADSMVRARNAPLPGPDLPGSKRFWRVKVDPDVDTDSDGSPDWAEFEIVARGTGMLVPGVTGDPFNPDTNGDGIPDGEQLDADGDGPPDAKDPDASDNTAVFPLGPLPRYAMFPITNAEPSYVGSAPFQINDKGTVLYQNGIWAGGKWTDLIPPSVMAFPQEPYAIAINDNDVILGLGYFDTDDNPAHYIDVMCSWPSPQGEPIPITTTGSTGNTLYSYPSSNLVFGGVTPGPALSNDGRFTAETHWTEDDHQDMRTGYWKLPDATHPMASEIPGSFGVDWSQGADMKWGKDVNASKGVIYAPGRLPDLTIIPFNVATIQGTVLAMPSANSNASAQVFVQGAWKTSSAYANAIDISSGGIAIGRNHDGLTAPTHMNGKWTGIERTAPGVPSAWKDQTVILLDTTPGGWILAGRGNTVPQLEHAVMLPIKVDGVDPDYVPPTLAPNTPAPEPPEYLAGGVDRISMMAEGGSGRVAEMWIMAPNGGASNTVRIRSPVSDTCSLTLASNPDVSFTPEILNQKDTQVQVSGKSTDSVDDSVTLKLGGTLNSLSAPIKIKAMKKRIVNVALHKVIGLDANGAPTPPAYMPIPADLKAYLDKIYGPQVNVTFNVTPFDETGPAGGIDFDLNNDNKLTGDSGNSERDAATPNAKAGIVSLYINIDVWVIGGSVSLMYMNGYLEERAYGNRFHGNKILVDGDMTGLTSKFVGKEMDHVLHTIAHEIGHVMTRDNHPGEELNKSTLVWDGNGGRDPYLRKRLMCAGPSADHKNPGKCLIKKEWDKIEEWLKSEETRFGRSL